MTKITSYRIVEHGIDHDQYFPGHGTTNTEYIECATGIGDTPQEALEDALEQLAMYDWDVESVDDTLEGETLQEALGLSDDEMEDCDAHWYVSVDVCC
jgi:hypothetical protein